MSKVPEPMLLVIQRNICSYGSKVWMNVELKLLRRGRCSLRPRRFIVDTPVEVVVILVVVVVGLDKVASLCLERGLRQPNSGNS